MSLDAKWSEGLTPTMPVVEAARLILTSRFDTLLKWWAEAEAQPDDADLIHHLRVASRRASAAMRAFDDLIPRGQSRTLRKQMRCVRSAAGEVRDRDVFLELLEAWAKYRGDYERPGLDYLAGIWTHVRMQRYERLAPELRRHERFSDTAGSLKIRGGQKTTLHDRAGEVIPRLAAKLSDAAADGVHIPNGLHAVRIVGKRLRYGVELFACCYPLNQLTMPYGLLEELQDILGATHDAEINARRVKRELAMIIEKNRYRPGIEAWLSHLQAVENDGPERFSGWLGRWQVVAPALGLGRANNS